MSLIEGYINDVNTLNHSVCEGRLSDIARLEAMNIDEYYSTINTFIKIQKQKAKNYEKHN
jgi:hypothetical protein